MRLEPEAVEAGRIDLSADRDALIVTYDSSPGESTAEANPWIDYVVATGTGHARNLAVVASCEAAIALGGRWGTAAEIAYARLLGRPVVVLGPGPGVDGDGIARAASPAEAVELALGLVEAR